MSIYQSAIRSAARRTRLDQPLLKQFKSQSWNDLNRAYSTQIPTSSLLSYRTMPNGIRVAGEETPGHFSALGVYINAGSRFERVNVPGESGASHVMDRMAFKSTKRYTAEELSARLEKLGGNFQAASSRETIMYQASMFNQDIQAWMSVFADTILNAKFDGEEMGQVREDVAWEVQNLKSKPEAILPEILHEVAYKGNTLGNPLLCPEASIPLITTDLLRDFSKAWYTPERIVIAGAGMPFEQLYSLSEQYFGGLESTAKKSGINRALPRNQSMSARSTSSPLAANFSSDAKAQAKYLENADLALRPEIASEVAQYTGGERYTADANSEFTHVYVAFESMSINDEDIYALSVLQMLLGGGGSFSAGGPGKGMYSRLYTNVLNQHHAVDYCAAFHHCYADSGIFGIAMAIHPNWAAQASTIIAQQMECVCHANTGNGVRIEELTRAKNQLKSSLMMSLESRLVEVEDLGRQVQVSGRKVTVEEMCEKIDKVDLNNLCRVARRVFKPQESSKPLNFGLGSGQSSVVGLGNTRGLGDVRALLAQKKLGAPPTSSARL
ncbi:hypothetical protein CBS101457_004811 [Exobasidium rhododendri]|nr:hypothetical protein CBS101457_004811 [Exobasidium rhododendri]